MQLLGGLTAAQFLARHWQKRPLLVRSAIPGFRDPLTPRHLQRLACRPEVESRLVWRQQGKWRLEHGPLAPARFADMGMKNWTVLVQGLNLQSDKADALLRLFRFLPAARLDDIMASYAAPGGGVGPHVDSYDVFLLQGKGRRRWRISRQADHRLRAGAPLAVLSHFQAEEEWTLEPGDMLYLPPQIAHEGVALDECVTWSIGFRAPAPREIGAALLDRLDQLLHAAAMPPIYSDRNPGTTFSPGRIPAGMVGYAGKIAALLKLTDSRIEAALGQALSEPKAGVSFDSPEPAMSGQSFAAAMRARGLRLDRRTQLLYRSGNFYINGEVLASAGFDGSMLRELSDNRCIPACPAPAASTHGLLYRWYLYGWLHAGSPP